MRLTSMIIIGLILTSPLLAGEQKFTTWWKNYDEQVMVDRNSARHYVKKKELRFETLPEYHDSPSAPAAVEGKAGRALVLHQSRNLTLLLVLPHDTMNNVTYLNDEYRQAIARCSSDRSWIVVLPENAWTEIDLNPYCTMDYGEDQITIDLYWHRSSRMPFIDVVTRRLTCIPHELYGWDRRARAYELKERKCTGARSVELFTGNDLFLKQLF
jgi:hypothetical protein